MRFADPAWLLLLLLLPLLAWWRRRSVRRAAFQFSSVRIVKNIANLGGFSSETGLRLLRWSALTLAVIALARPQIDRGETRITASGIDIVVAFDLSGSMAAEDFELEGERVNRVTIARETLKRFIEGRPSDQIGLVAFAGRAYVANPLTLDHRFFLLNLERLDIGLIEDGTAIGSAIAAGLNRLRDRPSKSRIMILMTDGQNTAGKVPPLTAAEAAETLGVKIYTIGVGTRGTAPMPRMDPFRGRVYVPMEVDIDEDTLRRIADLTGGRYFRADRTETLEEIYREIDELEKTEVQITKYQDFEELYAWLALPALSLLLLEIVLANTAWRKLP